jgi:hypothetical protein
VESQNFSRNHNAKSQNFPRIYPAENFSMPEKVKISVFKGLILLLKKILDKIKSWVTSTVPDRRSRILPEVVLKRRWVNWGSGNLEGGGLGEGLGQGRSVYKQPETEVDGCCHI